jgi:hypothetical protein
MERYKLLKTAVLGFLGREQYDAMFDPGTVLEFDGSTIWVVRGGNRFESITAASFVPAMLENGTIVPENAKYSRYRRHAFQPGQQAEVAAYRMAEQRCVNPNDPCWKDFGGRKVEFRFKSFREFWDAVGPRPEGRSGKLSAYSIGRLDKNGHFEPGNVAWVLRGETRRKRPKPASIPEFVAANPGLTYGQVGEILGCSCSTVCLAMTKLGVRRTRGKRAETPVQGTQFGKWTVQGGVRQEGKWLCRCECGTERWVRSNNLKSGRSTNCGCAESANASRADAWTPEMRRAMSERMKRVHADHPGRNRWRRKLTDEQVREIKAWHGRGLGYHNISKRYGVSPGAIEHIIKGRTYKDCS